MMTSPLSRIGVERHFAALQAELGQADKKRLAVLPPLIGADRRIHLSDALSALFPDQDRAAALTSFRQFRGRIAAAAADAKIRLTLDSDTQTRAAPDERWCWFAGDDGTAEAAAQFTDAETRNVVRVPQTAVQVGKRSVRYFISYAHADARLKDRLVSLLGAWFDSANDYIFMPWQDGDILVGSEWHEQIQDAIKVSDFGLLLVSPAFLASPYITREELQHFIAPDPLGQISNRVAVPVAVSGLRFDGSMDMKGLEARQIFRDRAGKAFEDRSTGKPRKDFVNELFGKIVQRLNNHFADIPLPMGWKRHPDAWQRNELAYDLAGVNFVTPQGHTGKMNKLDDEAPDGERKDAVQFLLDWAREPDGPSCCALLGSVGIGKTTTSKAFAHRLLQDREADPLLPMPIYLDLRHLGEAAKQEPNLKAILETVLRRSWQGGAKDQPLDAEEVIRLVQRHGAVVIFDGLDEVLVHLSQQGGQFFTRELLRILPPGLWPGRRDPDEPGRPGRVMLTCRTHYFRSLREQQTHLTLEDRDDVRDSDYRVFILLPFDEGQIHTYLAQTFPNREVDPILETIRAVHNLSEMATRPYTLSLIARSLPQIERWQLQGRRVTGVDLYRHMVLSWLERDSGKHEFDIDHKQQIMEHVSAALWRSGGRTWTARQMEDWLAVFLEQTPDVSRHYRAKDLDLLKKDLRTATFLIGGGQSDFRFAHSSLQEFFLAAYLLRALRETRTELWDMAKPSRETMDFLGQMLLGEKDDAALEVLRRIGLVYQPRVSENVFHFILFAQARGYPAPQLAGFFLDGADLSGLAIEGKLGGPSLDLTGVSFRGAQLSKAVFRNVNLDDTDFAGADLLRVEFNDGCARRACFDQASLQGAVFRAFDLSAASFVKVSANHTQFLRCTSVELSCLDASPLKFLSALCRPPLELTAPAYNKSRLTILNSYLGMAHAYVFSADGSRFGVLSKDGTLGVWDSVSGDCLMTLRCRESSLTACAFSPDGRRIVSLSENGTLRTWDTASGECLMTLGGYEDLRLRCWFSPDGGRIASLSKDGALRVRDTDSGDCLTTLYGGKNRLLTCVFSPDGRRLASGSADGTLSIWDAASGDRLTMLSGRGCAVQACAFSPDGDRVTSAFDDNTLQVWDALDGESLVILLGQQKSVLACAFSSDGRRIASGSSDGALYIWDAATGDSMMRLRGREGPLIACSFSRDGGRVASGSSDGTLRLWDAETGAPIGFQAHLLRHGGVATLSADGTRILCANDEAWRDLAWLIPDATGALIRYPAETFGPLPGTTT